MITFQIEMKLPTALKLLTGAVPNIYIPTSETEQELICLIFVILCCRNT